MAITRKPYAGGPIPNGWEKIPGMSKFIRPIAVAPEDVESPAEAKDDETMHIVKVVSLPGPTGKDGIDGKDGKDGKDGIDGKDGRDGIDGINGVDGKHGKDGKAGPKGLDGKDGKDGKDGEDARGIKKIVSHGSDMEIELTDGSKSRHKLATGGGSSFGGSSPSLGTMAKQDANTVAVTGGAISNTSITVKDDVFTLQDNLDPTKQAQFQLSGIGTGTTVTYTLPAISSTLAALGQTQTFTAGNTFSANTNTFGSSTGTGTQGLASGATTTGNTKTVNIGTGGLSGSTTNITVGSANGSTTTMLGSTVIGGVAGNQSLQVNNVASAVNYAQIVGAVAGAAPSISAQGADPNVNLQLLAQGLGTVNAGAITNGTNQFNVAVNAAIYRVGGGGAFRWIAMNTSFLAPSIVTSGQVLGNQEFQGYDGTTYRNCASVRAEVDGTPSASSMPGRLILSTTLSGAAAVTERFRIDNAGIISLGAAVGTESLRVNPAASAVNRIDVTGAATGAAPTISAQGSDTNIPLVLTGKGTGVVALGGSTVANSSLVAYPIASSVNYMQATGAATGANPAFSAIGTDANIGLFFIAKGVNGATGFSSAGNGQQFRIATTASAVNYIQATGAVTTGAPELSAQGSDANINIKLIPKGTGVLQFGTYTAGILAQAGYITITDAGGTSRRLLVG